MVTSTNCKELPDCGLLPKRFQYSAQFGRRVGFTEGAVGISVKVGIDLIVLQFMFVIFERGFKALVMCRVWPRKATSILDLVLKEPAQSFSILINR